MLSAAPRWKKRVMVDMCHANAPLDRQIVNVNENVRERVDPRLAND